MKQKEKIKRWSRKILPQGNSLCVSIPADLVKEWGLALSDEIVVYQLPQALLLVPLTTLLKHGEVKVLRPLQEALS